MLERRQHARESYTETFYCAVTVLDIVDTKILNLVARTVDVGKDGIGIKTDYPLELGHVLRLNNSKVNKAGVVIWSRNEEIKGIHRAGVKFV